jgi:hypothetical protein
MTSAFGSVRSAMSAIAAAASRGAGADGRNRTDCLPDTNGMRFRTRHTGLV